MRIAWYFTGGRVFIQKRVVIHFPKVLVLTSAQTFALFRRSNTLRSLYSEYTAGCHSTCITHCNNINLQKRSSSPHKIPAIEPIKIRYPEFHEFRHEYIRQQQLETKSEKKERGSSTKVRVITSAWSAKFLCRSAVMAENRCTIY